MPNDFTDAWDNLMNTVGASQFEKLDESQNQEQSEPVTLESLSAESDRQRELAEKKRLEEEEAKKERKKEQANKRKEASRRQGLSALRNQNGEALTKILKGIRQGLPPAFLLLLATDALSQLLNQANVGEQIERELMAVYGIGLEDSEVLDIELEDVRERKANLEKALELKSHLMKDDEKKRLKNAIREHESEIQRLETLKKKSGTCPQNE